MSSIVSCVRSCPKISRAECLPAIMLAAARSDLRSSVLTGVLAEICTVMLLLCAVLRVDRVLLSSHQTEALVKLKSGTGENVV